MLSTYYAYQKEANHLVLNEEQMVPVSTTKTIPLKQTRKAYSLIQKKTGSIGGSSHGGAIYGEITIGSMQNIVNLMKEHTNLGPVSRFIDVGCGLGKPNIHVALDPGVEFSYGIEIDRTRWVLGMNNLDICLTEIEEDQSKQSEQSLHRCILEHGDIMNAKSFDPFTHVYMFDVGFPPKLLKKLAEIYNHSQSQYLICYHGPTSMKDYGFDIELMVKVRTKMHGSGSSHMGYIYCRANPKKKNKNIDLITINGKPCDYLFYKAWMKTKKDLSSIHEGIKNQIMFARLTSKRSIHKHRELEQVLLSTTISSNKVKKQNNIGKTSLPLLATKRELQSIHKVVKRQTFNFVQYFL